MIAKQVLGELRYRKINKKKAVILLLHVLTSLFFHSWIWSWSSIWYSMYYLKKKEMEKEMPEVTCFLPAEFAARQKYAAVKGYLESGLMSLYIMICMLLSQIPSWENWVLPHAVFDFFLIGINYLIMSTEMTVIGENIKYRRIDKMAFRDNCCPIWYRVLDIAIIAVRIVIVWNIFLSAWVDTILVLLISLAALIIMHIFRMRHILFTMNMGDYNSKGEEE